MPDTSWTYNVAQGTNELSKGSIGLSLSGGGYRATLYAAGAIAALCDADLWPKVVWVASVSGGSFTNATAALLLDDRPGRSEVDAFLRHVAERTRRPL
ncbi:MAG: Lysophospholipase catalytic domain [Actinomycetota bacterium]